MRFLPYELLAAANGWIDQGPEESQTAQKRFDAAVESYFRHLDTIRDRLSKPAWQFFRYGGGRYGLHDGRLLRLSAGDGLDYPPDGRQPFRLNLQRVGFEVEFLNYE